MPEALSNFIKMAMKRLAGEAKWNTGLKFVRLHFVTFSCESSISLAVNGINNRHLRITE
jgi:hypothetical protein